MKGKTKLTALLLLGALASTTIGIGIFCYANFTRAADSAYAGLAITEIMYNPAGNNTDHAKWVELANFSSQKITLNPTGSETASGWKIKDLKITDSSNHYLYTQKNTPIEINPSDFLIITNDLINFDKDYKDYPGLKNVSILKSAIALSTADSNGFYNLTLYDNTYVLDTITYSKSWYPNSDDNGKSLEKIDLLGDNVKENWRESCKNGGTPGEEPKECKIETDPPNGNSNTTDPDDETQDPSGKCVASSEDIKLNEIFPYPGSGNEFVEITNIGKNCVDVSDWKIMDEVSHKKTFPENSIIHPGKYLFLEGNLYLNNNSDAVYLLAADVDAKSEALDNVQYEKAKKDFSFGLNGENWQWTSTPTPGEKNIFEEAETETADTGTGENYSSAEKVFLNEILPNPKGGSDDEYIEIVNGESEPVNLLNWTIRDASKTGKYVFKERTNIAPNEYLVIYRPQSKIALNNSEESIYLYNAQGKITSNVSYGKSQKNASYSFDGKDWKWSKYLTPGKKNKFDSEPSVKIKKPKNVFKDIFANFFAKAKDKETKNLKYAWDFGDGKKSYLRVASHKYLATGKYTVTLSVSDESQTVEKSFALTVKKYPRPDLEIAKIVPNPAGRDTDGEIVEIRNNSGKKIDLKGWKIATGSDGKMNNHLISGEINLDPNETKTITRETCKFSLNNKVGKVRLISPDGKITDEVEYEKEKIEDDETYEKIDGKWQWSGPPKKEDDNQKENSESNGEVLGATDENQTTYAPMEASYTSEAFFIFLSAFGLFDVNNEETNCRSAQNQYSNLAFLLIPALSD